MAIVGMAAPLVAANLFAAALARIDVQLFARVERMAEAEQRVHAFHLRLIESSGEELPEEQRAELESELEALAAFAELTNSPQALEMAGAARAWLDNLHRGEPEALARAADRLRRAAAEFDRSANTEIAQARVVSRRAAMRSVVMGVGGAVMTVLLGLTVLWSLRRATSHLRQRARYERSRVDKLIERMPVPTARFRGREHVLELANSAYTALWPTRSQKGRRLREAHPELASAGWVNALDRAFRENATVSVTEVSWAVESPSGGLQSAWFNLTVEPMRDVHGRPKGVLVVAVDVSELVQARQSAEREARQRAAAFEAEQRARAEAESAVQARDEFLSIASHELMTPLTALQLQLRRLARPVEGPEGEARREAALAAAMRTSQRLARLAANLLDVSDYRSGKVLLELEPVDLVEAFRETSARFEQELAKSGSHLNVFADGPVVGRWDRLRIDQIASNLLSNAIKFGAGKPIEVRLERAESEDVARVTVRDRGLGIAEEDQDRVFQRFERAVSSRHFGGLGLGLWITRQSVLMLGGRIRLSSEPGRGSVFEVELPLHGPGPQA